MSEHTDDYGEKNKQLLKELLYETRKMSIIIKHQSRISKTNNG